VSNLGVKHNVCPCIEVHQAVVQLLIKQVDARQCIYPYRGIPLQLSTGPLVFSSRPEMSFLSRFVARFFQRFVTVQSDSSVRGVPGARRLTGHLPTKMNKSALRNLSREEMQVACLALGGAVQVHPLG